MIQSLHPFSNIFLSEEEAPKTLNPHLVHIEDAVFHSFDDSILAIDTLKSLSTTTTQSKNNLTLKYDGKPAIIAGFDLKTRKFFVGTKSAISPNGNRIFSPQDAKMYYGKDAPQLAKLLIQILHYTKEKLQWNAFPPGTYLFGDFLYTANTLKIVKTKNGENIHFTPNTVTYSIPLESEIGSAIHASSIGFVWHTRMMEKKDGTTTKEPLTSTSELPKTLSPDVWQTLPHVRTERIQKNERIANPKIIRSLEECRKMVTKYQHMIQEDVWNNRWISICLEKYAIQCSRSRTIQSGMNTENFMNYAEKTFAPQNWKTPARLNGFNESLFAARKSISILLNAWNVLHTVKLNLVISYDKNLEDLVGFTSFIGSPKNKSSEGFVVTPSGSTMFKLVDRQNFSAANFVKNDAPITESVESTLLVEGGGAVKGVSPIHSENTQDTLKALYDLLSRMGLNQNRITTLGSTGKKRPGEVSGDLDICIDCSSEKNSLELIGQILSKQLHGLGFSNSSWNKGLHILSFAFPIVWKKNPLDRGKSVQVDLFLTVRPRLTAFVNSAPHTADSQYKGIIKKRILFAIAYYANLKEDRRFRTRWLFNDQEGLVRARQEKVDGGTHFKTVEVLKVLSDPSDIAKVLLGQGFTVEDMYSVETLIMAMKSPKFAWRSKLKEIKYRAYTDILDNENVKVPELLERW